MVTSFLVLSIFANTAFLASGSEYVELCVITVDDVTITYEGECKDVAKYVLDSVRHKHPSSPVELILNGRNLNQV